MQVIAAAVALDDAPLRGRCWRNGPGVERSRDVAMRLDSGCNERQVRAHHGKAATPRPKQRPGFRFDSCCDIEHRAGCIQGATDQQDTSYGFSVLEASPRST
jgi:hypothetical protein